MTVSILAATATTFIYYYDLVNEYHIPNSLLSFAYVITIC